MRPGRLRAALPAVVAIAIAVAPQPAATAAARTKPMGLVLRSSSFKPNGEIPKVHTGDGKDLSPPLAWTGAPAETRSFALIVDDPDAPDPKAPRMVWVHWVIYDLPAQTTALPEGATAKTLPEGTREGLNDWKQTGWRGPSPPVGRHRYVFKLYALDTVLPDLETRDKAHLLAAMEGHVLATSELVGTYARH